MKISAVVITKNEEHNLRRCLDSVKWADEIVVVDSQSTDKTVDIAKEYHAKIISPKWRGFGIAKGAGVTEATGDWIFSIDADEEVTKELQDEIINFVKNPKEFKGLFIRRKTQFLGRWIKHSGWYPDYVLRLFRKNSGQFDDAIVHEKVVLNGKSAYSKYDMLHYSYPDLDHYFDKFNKYTTLGAKELYEKGRRFNLSDITIRPLAAFLKHYFFKSGFLDGIEGFVLAVLSSVAVLVKYSKLYDLQRKKDR